MSQIDGSIPRVEVEGFACPLGVYPTEPGSFSPVQGYYLEFEPADSGDEEGEEWEEWPDRYMFDVVVTHRRLGALLRTLMALLPGRVYPILDVLGHDAYREIDPYIAYDAVGIERFMDAFRRHRGWLMEDGLVGFGAMSVEPFIYVYVDEHKIVTVRAETALREKVERALAAFDLPALDEPKGVDSVEHEHREALAESAGEGEEGVMTRDEIVDELRDVWGLTLNIDPSTNVDDEGNDLGVTAWRCVVRLRATGAEEAEYVEALLTADCLAEAERLALDAAERFVEAGMEEAGEAAPEKGEGEGEEGDEEALGESEVVIADRVTGEEFADLLGGPATAMDVCGVHAVRRAR